MWQTESVQTEAACCDVVLVLGASVTASTKDIRPTRTLTVEVALKSRWAGHVTLTRCINTRHLLVTIIIHDTTRSQTIIRCGCRRRRNFGLRGSVDIAAQQRLVIAMRLVTYASYEILADRQTIPHCTVASLNHPGYVISAKTDKNISRLQFKSDLKTCASENFLKTAKWYIDRYNKNLSCSILYSFTWFVHTRRIGVARI